MKTFKDTVYSSERALYGISDAKVENCIFAGEEDGESALKESKNIQVDNCRFELRYPFWHSTGFDVKGCRLTETCRASFWYCINGQISDTEITGVKALRECENVNIKNVNALSSEFGWKCRDIKAENCSFQSEYIFFDSKNISLDNIILKGKYSFQYTQNLTIKNSQLETKDSFWHASNVVVENCTVKGEYLGWYSDGLTLRNCKIIGTQPFCYCKNLILENCELVDCDLAFEYSDVIADTHGHIISIKNVKSGKVYVDSVGEIITTNPVYECCGKVIVRGSSKP